MANLLTHPSKTLLLKYFLTYGLVFILIFYIPGILIITVILELAQFYVLVHIANRFFFVSLLYLVANLFIYPYLIYKYFSTINFEFLENELHLHRGLVTQSSKIVPYRTITNITIKRDPLDRLLGIGTLLIMTAASSNTNTSKAEENFSGIPADQLSDIQSFILGNIQRYSENPGTHNDLPKQPEERILEQVKEINKLLQKRMGVL